MRRVLLAQVLHETNTFSVRPATLEAFRQRELLEGEAVIEAARFTNTELAGFIDGGLAKGWKLIPVVAAEATPCGRVSESAWQYFRDRIVAAVEEHAPVDAVLLALHGAMVCDGVDDADGALVADIREATGANAIIGCTLDLHANPSDRLAESANILVPYASYPHVDMRARGEELTELVREALATSSPWRSHVFRNRQLDGCDQGRSSGVVMPELVSMAARASEPNALRVGVCAGFPWADVPHAGPSVLVSGSLDREAAKRRVAPILDRMWETRAQTSLVAHDSKTAVALAQDRVARGRRVLIADFSDNPGGGGYGSTTALLAELLKSDRPATVFAPLCDATAAAVCAQRPIGSDISITLGTVPDGSFSGPPLTLQGKLVSCADVEFRAVGPMWTGRQMRLGTTAVISSASVEIVITSYPLQVTEPAYLQAAGIDFDRMRIIAIKSLQHFRAAFEPLVDDILFADSGGLVSSGYQRFPYRKVRRPIWPLDAEATQQ